MRIQIVRIIMTKELKEYMRHAGNKFMIIAFPLFTVILYLCIILFREPEDISLYVKSASGFYYVLILLGFISVYAISSSLATESFLGESDRKTLELLFATPISDLEILVGKASASILPGLISSYSIIILKTVATLFLLKFYKSTVPIDYTKIFFLMLMIFLLSLLLCGLLSLLSSHFSSRNFVNGLSIVILLPLLGLIIGMYVRIFNSTLFFCFISLII